jgi:DNA-binding SARP family transcriptional activator
MTDEPGPAPVAGPAAEPVLQLRLLGTCAVLSGGRSVDPGARQLRLLAALALLGRRARGYLGGLLWPGCPDARALGSLRAAVCGVNHHLPGALVRDGHDLALSPALAVDVHVLRARLTAVARTEDPVALDAAGLLDPGVPALLPGWYEEWVLAEQEQLRGLYVHAAEHAAALCLAHGYPSRAVRWAEAVRGADPLRESAVRLLVCAHLALGNQAAALRDFRRYCAVAVAETGAGPSDELVRLVGPVVRL